MSSDITAELGRAPAVVKVTLQVNGNSQLLGVCPPPKTIGAIKIKSGKNDYVVMAVILRYFTEFGKHAFQHMTASICGGIYARVYCIL